MRRRLMLKSGAGVTPVLPAEYQRVEYIGSRGTQYFVTSVLPSKTSIIKIKFGNVGNAYSLFAAGNDTNNRVQLFFIGSNTPCLRAWSNMTTTLSIIAGIAENLIEINYASATAVLNGTTHIISMDSGASDIIYPYAIFAQNTAGTISTIVSCDIYSFVIEDDGEIVLNLIPCYRKSDNEIGMFDTVSGTFYTNIGAGTFSKGADI